MRIAVIGASGALGAEVVMQALVADHEVVALAPTPSRITFSHPHLRALRGDVHELDSLRAGFVGVEAVMSVFGSPVAPSPDHYANGIANVLAAMIENRVTRIVVVSLIGAVVRDDPNLPFLLRLRLLRRSIGCYDDLERMEQRVMASGLTWTIVRIMGVSDSGPTGKYRVDPEGRALPKGGPVSRGDLAAFIVRAISTTAYDRRAVSVASPGADRIPASSI